VIIDGDRPDRLGQGKNDLAADAFDNGRSAEALRRAFANAPHVAYAWDGDDVVGMARMLSDSVSNAYLLDVWTRFSHRRRGIGSSMVRHLMDQVPGQHVGLQTDAAVDCYEGLGFRPQPQFLSIVVGAWQDNERNR
jgi:ribosomal protein S18 acetylase RimI-like enzyme